MDAAEIRSFIEAYYAAFVPGNTEAVLPFYAEPALIVSEDYAIAAETRDSLRELIEGALSALAAIGFSHSRSTYAGIHPLGPALCRAAIRCERIHRDGSVLATLGATYLLRREDARWQIVSVAVHAPDVDDLRPPN
jgi:ketosteroid isomerase-like protein